jgi:hypothetical protein
MIDSVLDVVGIAILSFALTYGMYYLGVAMNAIFSYAYGMSDWRWE